MGKNGAGRRGKCGQGLYSREELILSFAAWNSLQNHLLTSCNIMVMLYNFHLWHKVPAKAGALEYLTDSFRYAVYHH